MKCPKCGRKLEILGKVLVCSDEDGECDFAVYKGGSSIHIDKETNVDNDIYKFYLSVKGNDKASLLTMNKFKISFSEFMTVKKLFEIQ